MKYGSGKYTYELVDPWVKPMKEVENFVSAVGVTVDAEDNVYVYNRSKYPMIVFDRDGNELSHWGEGMFTRPHGSYMTPDGYLWLSDDLGHVMQKFTKDGKLVMTLGTKDTPSNTGYREGRDAFESLNSIKRMGPPFNRPTNAAVSSTGDIFVTDGYGNARVHKFSPDGKLLLSWGEPGGKPGQFRAPHSVWVDRQDRVWISDRENHRVQIFDTEGKLLDLWTDFMRPTYVFIDKDDTVYVSELSRRISILTIDGKLITQLENATPFMDDTLLVGPHACCVDSHGDLYVSEVAMSFAKVNRGLKCIRKFKTEGEV